MATNLSPGEILTNHETALEIDPGNYQRGVCILALLAGLALYCLGEYRLEKKYSSAPVLISIPADQPDLLEGQRIFRYRGCEACHGEELRDWFTSRTRLWGR